MNVLKEKLKAYRFPLILLSSIFIGSIVGFIFGEKSNVITPLGDIFINLLFMVVIPLVFFSISSSISYMISMLRLGKTMGSIIFINLLFIVVIPLVFFSISSAIANMNSMRRLGKIMGSMISIFVLTGLIASIVMLAATVMFPPGSGTDIPLETPDDVEQLTVSE